MEWLAPRPGRFAPGKTQYPLYRRLGKPQGRSGRVRENLARTVIRSLDRPARSESLYWLRYPGPQIPWTKIIKIITIIIMTACHTEIRNFESGEQVYQSYGLVACTPCSLVDRYKLLGSTYCCHMHAILMEQILAKCYHLSTILLGVTSQKTATKPRHTARHTI
jgi:hypothetical protein